MVAIKTEKLPSLSIVFPAHNEEDNIGVSIDRAQLFAKERGIDYEIIIVDDGSRDKTADIVRSEIKHDSRIHLVSHKVNLGYGATVYDGLKSAKKDLVFFMDSDLQFDINELDKFFKKINKFDAVIGYRNPRRDSFMRLINAWGWKYLVYVVYGIKVGDIDCAFKLFKNDVIKKINVKSRGAMFSPELIIHLIANKKKITELPVRHYKRVAGIQSGAKLKVILLAFKEIFMMRKELRQELSQIEGCDRIIS